MGLALTREGAVRECNDEKGSGCFNLKKKKKMMMISRNSDRGQPRLVGDEGEIGRCSES
jgi:hypothetical protein